MDRIQYWRDHTTGLLFYSPPEAAGEADIYLQLQRLPWYYMSEKWEFTSALRILAGHQSQQQLLEVGIGKGSFLQKAKLQGLDVSGVELNPDAAASARRLGFTIHEMSLHDLATAYPSCWDVVCAFQVIEHLPSPREFLEDAVRLLRPGGLLLLSVPNAEISCQLDPCREVLLDQPPHHMSHWDNAVFQSLEKLFPLKILESAYEPLAPYHVDWFVDSWAKLPRPRTPRMFIKVMLSRHFSSSFRFALSAGMRRFVRGHTLLACLEKQA